MIRDIGLVPAGLQCIKDLWVKNGGWKEWVDFTQGGSPPSWLDRVCYIFLTSGNDQRLYNIDQTTPVWKIIRNVEIRQKSMESRRESNNRCLSGDRP